MKEKHGVEDVDIMGGGLQGGVYKKNQGLH